MEQPERRWQITIQIGADSIEDIAHQLKEIGFQLAAYHKDADSGWSSVSGGWSSGHSYEVKFNPEMTGDLYRKLIQEYVEYMDSQGEQIDERSED